jgi:hypothetical protein
MRLHPTLDLFVLEIPSLIEEDLPHLVQCRIVQVLRLEGRFIDDSIAWVIFPDAMLLNKLHAAPSLEPKGTSVPSGNEPTLPFSLL